MVEGGSGGGWNRAFCVGFGGGYWRFAGNWAFVVDTNILWFRHGFVQLALRVFFWGYQRGHFLDILIFSLHPHFFHR